MLDDNGRRNQIGEFLLPAVPAHQAEAEIRAALIVADELYAMHGACSFREHKLQPRVQASKAQRMRDL
jgi:hypothetical protein